MGLAVNSIPLTGNKSLYRPFEQKLASVWLCAPKHIYSTVWGEWGEETKESENCESLYVYVGPRP